MKKLFLFVFVCFTALLFSGCGKSPVCNAPYAAQTYTLHDAYIEEHVVKNYGFGNVFIISTYKEYKAFGVELGYSKDYFNINELLVFMLSGCSSDNMRFTRLSDTNGILSPVVYRHEYLEDEQATEDVIFYVFYTEIPKDKNHTAGEINFVYER